MGTFIHGIAASENIDSSGERISIAGLDISSLAVDGVFNYEHKSDLPSQVVGKVLKARKIFTDADCEDEHQLYFWQKIQVPYLYVMGELFDDYKESAKDVAGMFRYDADKKGKQERNVMNFSIEGAKIDKQGMDILKSIARKVTITVLPCNKAAIAEMVVAATPKKKDDLSGIFKSEHFIEVEIFKSEMKAGIMPIKKEDPTKHATKLGIHPMHKEDNLGAIGAPTSPSLAMSKADALKDNVAQARQSRAIEYKKRGDSANEKIAIEGAKEARKEQIASAKAIKPNLTKAITAGAGNVAPGNLEGGSTLDTKLINPQLKKPVQDKPNYGKVINPPKVGVQPKGFGRVIRTGERQNKEKVKSLLLRAEQEYAQWDKREAFEAFMAKKMPHLAKGEIKAIGQTLVLKKSLDLEKSLAKLVKREDKIPGGLADKKSPKDFDAKKLAEGVKAEMEHTSDPKIAEEIAMDHLMEDPNYYEKLKTIEK